MNRKPRSFSLSKRRKQGRQMQVETLEQRRVLDSTVVFSEIMYNPVGPDDGTEWIEFYNQLAVDIDISEWQLTGGVEYEFPDGTVVPGRGYLLVAADPAKFEQTTGQTALGPWQGSLNNGGEELLLFNNDARRMNVVDYNDNGDWPVGADGTGLTLAKALRNLDSESVESWTTSEQFGGTPGSANFTEPGETIDTMLLGETNSVTAWVPTDGNLGTSWTAASFDDSGWLSGTGGVGYDTRSTYNSFFGLDVDAPPNDQTPTPMQHVNTSLYMRFPFSATTELDFDRLELRARYDDGFVVYLNGTEVLAVNAPGRNGEEGSLEWNSESTESHRDTLAVSYETFALSNAIELLTPGENVLAVHGLNRTLTDSDALWQFELTGVEVPEIGTSAPVDFSEVAAAGEAAFVEVRNNGTQPLNLNGFALKRTGEATPYQFGNQTLAPGEHLAIHQSQFATPFAEDEIIVLESTKAKVLDSVRVRGRDQARATERDDRWMLPASLTPNAPNDFSNLHDDIVISEIMYHPQPIAAVPDTPPTFETNVLLPFDHATWLYNDTGASLDTGWHNTGVSEGEGWKIGQGLIGYETSSLPVEINTQLLRPSSNDPRFHTYYFQTSFELSADDLLNVDALQLSHIIDDGAIFYLNGQEISRFNMDPGEVTSETRAARSTVNASNVGPIDVPSELLQVGTNRFSAEVHLRSDGSSDIVFGAELSTGTQITELIPGSPFRERDELEWLELYNKGEQSIDVSGWEIEDAIGFEFPEGTSIAAGDYLVVAKDLDAFSAAYPNVNNVLGGFDRGLGDQEDNIVLVDATGNIADEVHYFEGGSWPGAADGGGSSLQLVDPNADNNKGASWIASDESGGSEWTTYSFSGTSLIDPYNRAALFDEFVFGLLTEGEFLIDDVEVIKHEADGDAHAIQNGTFESDTVGQAPDKWRLIGNHSGTVVMDPTDANNQALHVIATGAQAHVHDHAETTFLDGVDIDDGINYTISFRTKWLTGGNQLNNRLWFSRLSNTHIMHVPLATGTPGEANPETANSGPTYDGFAHHPVNPFADQTVTVQTQIEDPDGVASSQLWWRVEGQAWNSTAMTLNAAGLYTGEIPAYDSGTIVQFYVEATDTQGAVSTFPADGADSRALYQVEDSRGPDTPIDRYRIIIMDEESDLLFAGVNRMSNWTMPVTLVHGDTPYYDVSVRQTGSRWIRPNSGYKVRLNPDQLLYGVHDTVRFDLNGMAEIVMKQMLNRAGGHSASNYDDLGFLVVPNASHTHHVIVQMARYENVFLNEQFEDGSNGTKWELDDVTVPTSPNGGIEGLKDDTAVNETADIGVNTTTVSRQGDNPEFYRSHLLIKSNRSKDNFQAIVDLAQAIHKEGDELFEATNEVMDVDLWMRHYANQAYFGNWDTYGFRRPKNLRIYQRPEDDRIIPLFWDCDLCNFSETIKTASESTSRLDEIRDIPHNLRLFWGHMYDYVNRSFNEEYVAHWATHYGGLINNQTHGGDETFTGIARSTATRSAQALRDMERDIPRVDFSITTNDGNDVTVDTPTIMLEGKGWVDVRQIRLVGTEQPLDVYWPTEDGWQFEFPLRSGTETIALEAVGWDGAVISTQSINVSTTAGNPVAQSLRISEIQYHPSDPTEAEAAAGFDDGDDFEYVELHNIGDETISLAGVAFQQADDETGLAFNFSNETTLAPGETIVVVEDLDAFRLRYGAEITVAGQWNGGLSNDSETITLVADNITIHQFSYDDQWYPDTDGEGRSLQIRAIHGDVTGWGDQANWRPSSGLLGSPGIAEPAPGDLNNDGLFNSSDLVAAFTLGGYEDGIPNNAQPGTDFDGDGDFTSADFVFAFIYNHYTTENAPAARPVQLDGMRGADPTAQVSSWRKNKRHETLISNHHLTPLRQIDAAWAELDDDLKSDSESDELSPTLQTLQRRRVFV